MKSTEPQVVNANYFKKTTIRLINFNNLVPKF